MQVRTAKAAILAQSRQPLVIDEIMLPDTLEAGQVLVQVLHTTICGAQINEIEAAKGPDRFLPHLLGHEASAIVRETGPGVMHVKPGDTVVLHWRPSQGIQSRPPRYSWNGAPLNAGWVTTFNQYAVVSENRMTVLAPDFDPKVAPLLGCAVTTAAGVINNDAKVKLGESVVVFGVGGVGLNLVQFAALAGAHPIVAVDLVPAKLDMARARGATHALDAGKVDVAAGDPRDRRRAGSRQGDRDHRREIGDRARLRAHAPRRHLRAGRRAEREGDDLDAADPFQQGTDRLAWRRRGAACRHSAPDQARRRRQAVVRRASSRTSFRSTRSTPPSTWCAAVRRARVDQFVNARTASCRWTRAWTPNAEPRAYHAVRSVSAVSRFRQRTGV
jgi:hypothetical protein